MVNYCHLIVILSLSDDMLLLKFDFVIRFCVCINLLYKYDFFPAHKTIEYLFNVVSAWFICLF